MRQEVLHEIEENKNINKLELENLMFKLDPNYHKDHSMDDLKVPPVFEFNKSCNSGKKPSKRYENNEINDSLIIEQSD